MRTTDSHRTSALQTWHLSIAVLLLLPIAIGCSAKRPVNSLKNFGQRGHQTLFEVVDRDDHSWKVGSMVAGTITAHFVINSRGQVDIVATTFSDRAGAKHAVVLVDSSEKEDALAVLDKRFLSGLTGSSGAYEQWLKSDGVFTYGAAQQTRTIDITQGGLGSGDIRVEGGTIVGRMDHARCHCSDFPLVCRPLPSPWTACLNKICDFANCVIDHINGGGSDCSQEGEAARTQCALAAGETP